MSDEGGNGDFVTVAQFMEYKEAQEKIITQWKESVKDQIESQGDMFDQKFKGLTQNIYFAGACVALVLAIVEIALKFYV